MHGLAAGNRILARLQQPLRAEVARDREGRARRPPGLPAPTLQPASASRRQQRQGDQARAPHFTSYGHGEGGQRAGSAGRQRVAARRGSRRASPCPSASATAVAGPSVTRAPAAGAAWRSLSYARTRTRSDATRRPGRRVRHDTQRALAAAGRRIEHAVEPQHAVAVAQTWAGGVRGADVAGEVVDLVDPAVLTAVAIASRCGPRRAGRSCAVRRRSQLPKSRTCQPDALLVERAGQCRQRRGARHLARAPRRPNHRRARLQGDGLDHRACSPNHHHLHACGVRLRAGWCPATCGTPPRTRLRSCRVTNFSSRLRRPSNAFTSST